MHLYIVTLKKGKHRGKLSDEWDYLRIVSVRAGDRQEAIDLAASVVHLTNLEGIEVSVV